MHTCQFVSQRPGAVMPNPFDLLGLRCTFDLDLNTLQAAYRSRAAALHPDRFTDPLQQAEAQLNAAALNDARAVLADDEQRANLVLALLGGPTKEQDRSLPDGFLADMMTIREEMDDALARNDADDRRRLEQWTRDRRQQHVGSVRSMLALAAGEPADARRLAAIRQELNAWRYIERMQEHLRNAR